MTENSDPEREKQVPPGRCLWPGGDLQAAARGMGARGAANPGRGVGDGGWGLGAPQHWSVRDEVPERGDLHGEHRVPRGLGWGLSAHEAAGGTPTGPRERPGPGTATRSCFVGAVLAKALLQQWQVMPRTKCCPVPPAEPYKAGPPESALSASDSALAQS